jgi:hypothetical protein
VRGALAIARHPKRHLPSVRVRIQPWTPTNVLRCGHAYVRNGLGRSAYRTLSVEDLLTTRRSDTAFIFGSGKSLLQLGPEEWSRIAEHDTIGFSQFQEQRFVRVDYHLISEALFVERYARLFRENPMYRDTVYVVQGGWLAHVGNELVGRRLLPEDARVFRFRRVARGRYAPPSSAFADGLVHGWNSSISTTNFGLVMGWKRLVLVGIDLYDREYFYLPPGATFEGEKPGYAAHSRFPGADGIVDYFRRWRPLAEAKGVELLVYNPRSLLAEVLDIFKWDAAADPAPARV